MTVNKKVAVLVSDLAEVEKVDFADGLTKVIGFEVVILIVRRVLLV